MMCFCEALLYSALSIDFHECKSGIDEVSLQAQMGDGIFVGKDNINWLASILV